MECNVAQPLWQSGVETHDPIQWSPDIVTVDKILTYCEYEVARIRREKRRQDFPPPRYIEAREAILERIYGNLCNVAYRAYPSEISFRTVASDLIKHFDNDLNEETRKAGYVAALESEWNVLRDYFKKNFPVRNPD